MKILLIIFVILIILILVNKLLNRRNVGHFDGKNAFDEIFKNQASQPKFESGTTHGFPYFWITFQSKEDLESATTAGLTDLFEKEIAKIHEDTGQKDNPFDVSRAILFTYEGETLIKLEKAGAFQRDENYRAAFFEDYE